MKRLPVSHRCPSGVVYEIVPGETCEDCGALIYADSFGERPDFFHPASATKGEAAMRIRFVIPNRDDADHAPTLYQYAEVVAVPRVGESVYLGQDEDSATPWRVKWVGHTLTVPVMSDSPAREQRIDVRLIEPDHWAVRDDA